jgi:hypothetical protein
MDESLPSITGSPSNRQDERSSDVPPVVAESFRAVLYDFSDQDFENVERARGAGAEQESQRQRAVRPLQNQGLIIAIVGGVGGVVLCWILVLLRLDVSPGGASAVVAIAICLLAILFALGSVTPDRRLGFLSIVIVSLSATFASFSVLKGLPTHLSEQGVVLAAIAVVIFAAVILVMVVAFWVVEGPSRRWIRENPDSFAIWKLSVAVEQLEALTSLERIDPKASNPLAKTSRIKLGRVACVCLREAAAAVDLAVCSLDGQSSKEAPEWLRSEARRRAWPLEDVAHDILLAPGDPEEARVLCRTILRCALIDDWMHAPAANPKPSSPSTRAQAADLGIGLIPIALAAIVALMGVDVPEWIWVASAYWAAAALIGAFDPKFEERVGRVKAMHEAAPGPASTPQ